MECSEDAYCTFAALTPNVELMHVHGVLQTPWRTSEAAVHRLIDYQNGTEGRREIVDVRTTQRTRNFVSEDVLEATRLPLVRLPEHPSHDRNNNRCSSLLYVDLSSDNGRGLRATVPAASLLQVAEVGIVGINAVVSANHGSLECVPIQGTCHARCTRAHVPLTHA